MKRLPAVLFGVVALTTSGWNPSPTTSAAIFAAAAVLSMPHGALDVITGPRVIVNRFALRYLTQAGATLTLWLLAPALAIAGFIATAWWHFGGGDAQHITGTRAVRICHGTASGGAVIAAAFCLNTEHVHPIVDQLALSNQTLDSGHVRTAAAAMGAVVTVAAAIALGAHLANRQMWHAAELATLAAIAIVAHPVIAFATYFVGVHSLRHIAEFTDRQIFPGDRWRIIGAAIAPIVIGAAILTTSDAASATIYQVAVIGLATLTTPHAALTDIHRNQVRAATQRSQRPTTSTAHPRRAPQSIDERSHRIS